MNNRVIFSTVLYITTFLLAGCDEKTEPSVDHKANVSAQNKASVKTLPTAIVKTVIKPRAKSANNNVKLATLDLKNKLTHIRQEMAKQQTFTINSEKITTTSGLFIKGETVHNLNINQDGILKGSLVVVLVENTALPAAIANSGKIKKIAKDTYQITIPAQQDLLTPYNRFKKMVDVEVVEMEIDYTPKNKHLD